MNYILEGFSRWNSMCRYVNKLLQLVRKSYGRAQFQVRWGTEEQRHMDALAEHGAVLAIQFC